MLRPWDVLFDALHFAAKANPQKKNGSWPVGAALVPQEVRKCDPEVTPSEAAALRTACAHSLLLCTLTAPPAPPRMQLGAWVSGESPPARPHTRGSRAQQQLLSPLGGDMVH